MILFFSGTGNSEYVAKSIGKGINDEVVDLFEKIRNDDFSELRSDRPWIVVSPTYAWRIPRILQHWLKRTDLVGNKEMYFVMTCGGNIGNADRYLEKLCAAKKMEHRGCIGIKMPENYIALFSTPTTEEALKLLTLAERVIDSIVLFLQKGERFPKAPVSFGDRVNSGIVNDLFYPLFVHAKKFYATDACISCGKCARLCPLENIRLENGKPVWGDRCTHCMACICRCPTGAIEYGKHSKGLPRYTCPKK